MNFKLGNLSPEEFAHRVGTHFTPAEITDLRAAWSRKAALVSDEDFHIFDAPSISVHVGSFDSRAVAIFKAANARQEFDRQVSFYLDREFAEVTA